MIEFFYKRTFSLFSLLTSYKTHFPSEDSFSSHILRQRTHCRTNLYLCTFMVKNPSALYSLLIYLADWTSIMAFQPCQWRVVELHGHQQRDPLQRRPPRLPREHQPARLHRVLDAIHGRQGWGRVQELLRPGQAVWRDAVLSRGAEWREERELHLLQDGPEGRRYGLRNGATLKVTSPLKIRSVFPYLKGENVNF